MCADARSGLPRSPAARLRRPSRASEAARCRSRSYRASRARSRRDSRRRSARRTRRWWASSATGSSCSTAARSPTTRWTTSSARSPWPAGDRGDLLPRPGLERIGADRRTVRIPGVPPLPVGRRAATPLTVGTAGHIDHGKTWLVRALTGKDTDRLPEEQRRGISIDLGYAPLELPDGRRLSLIDVPGHERFVRNMVAGATGIDLFLLVIDAAEGARPQTHEHLAILRLLGVERGVVAVTKADAVDAETLELAVAEARELVPEATVVAVSAKTGQGLDELRAALAAAAVETERPAWPTRLFVDRVFTLRGIGTVVTGTLWSGTLAEGDELRVEPGARTVRVRSVQVHDAPVESADAGQRVALALPGIERHELRRGDALVQPGAFPLSYRIDVALHELEPIADGARLNVHHGTSHTTARVVRADGYAQLRLAEPVVAARGDHVVLRSETTVGGGTVLDPAPPRALDPSRLGILEGGDAALIVRAIVRAPVTGFELQTRALLPPHELAQGLASVRSAGDWYFSDEWLGELRTRSRERLRRHAEREPLDPGLSVGQLLLSAPWANAIAP